MHFHRTPGKQHEKLIVGKINLNKARTSGKRRQIAIGYRTFYEQKILLQNELKKFTYKNPEMLVTVGKQAHNESRVIEMANGFGNNCSKSVIIGGNNRKSFSNHSRGESVSCHVLGSKL